MRELKADLHLHSAEDPFDVVILDGREVIDRAARLGYEVLAITNHLTRTYSPELEHYAADRNILLIPGAEVEVGRRHVLLLNPSDEALVSRTFEELRIARKRSDRAMAIIAPHPFFPSYSALRRWVIDNVDVFDALEYGAFYFLSVNFNRLASRVASKLDLPLIGNSDAHYSWQFGRTYSIITAEKTVEGVIEAIKKKRVRIVTRRLPLNRITLRLGFRALRIPEYMLWKEWREGDPFWDVDDMNYEL